MAKQIGQAAVSASTRKRRSASNQQAGSSINEDKSSALSSSPPLEDKDAAKTTVESLNNSEPPKESLPGQEELGVATQFLLADFTNLREWKDQDSAMVDKRMNLFVTLTSGLAVALAFLSQTRLDQRNFLFLILLGSLGSLTLGIATFRYVLRREILIVQYARNLNLIRGYFFKQAPSIQKVVQMPTSDEYPKFGWVSGTGHPEIVIVINSLLVGTCGTVITLLARNTTSLDISSVLFGVIFFLGAYLVQRVHGEIRYKQEEARAQRIREIGYDPKSGTLFDKPTVAVRSEAYWHVFWQLLKKQARKIRK